MSEKRRIENEEVLEKAIDVTTQHIASFFDIISDYELRYSNLEGHVLAIYGVDNVNSPVAIIPYFDGLRTYNIKDCLEIPTNKNYYIADITEYTGKDYDVDDYFYGNRQETDDYSVEGFKKLTMPRHKNEQIEIASQLAEEDSEDRFQGILGEQSIKEAIEDKVKEDIVSNPSHYTYANIEIIDIVEQITSQYPSDVAFAIGNVVKYVSRAPHKNKSEDLNKAMWYLQRAIKKYDEE